MTTAYKFHRKELYMYMAFIGGETPSDFFASSYGVQVDNIKTNDGLRRWKFLCSCVALRFALQFSSFREMLRYDG